MTAAISSQHQWPHRADGTPYRPHLPGRLPVPETVEIVGERLLWNYPHQAVRVPTNLLALFAELSRASDESVAAFARRFGVLELCEHDLPVSHWEDEHTQKYPCVPRPVDAELSAFWEPIEAWRKLARAVRAVVTLAAALHNERVPDPREWADVPFSDIVATATYLAETGNLGEPRLGERLDFDRRVLAGVVDYWLRLGGVRLHVAWTAKTPTVQLGGWGLFGALGVQLLQIVSRSDGASVCSACGKLFLTVWRRNPHRRCFCPECGKRAAWRAAARDHRKTP